MNNVYHPYIGSHENIMGCEVYVELSSGYICGKVVEYIYPKYGIMGKYKVKRNDGKIMTTPTIYIKE